MDLSMPNANDVGGSSALTPQDGSSMSGTPRMGNGSVAGGGQASSVHAIGCGNNTNSNNNSVSDKIEPGPNVVFMGGIPSVIQCSNEIVHFLTERFGAVEAFKLVMDTVTGKHKGYGFVRFANADVAENARQMRIVEFNGKMVNLGDAYSGGGGSGNGAGFSRRTPSNNNNNNNNVNNNNFHSHNTTNPYYHSAAANRPYHASGNSHMSVDGTAHNSTNSNTAMHTHHRGGGGARGGGDVCRYWMRGGCRKETQCPFKHPPLMHQNQQQQQQQQQQQHHVQHQLHQHHHHHQHQHHQHHQHSSLHAPPGALQMVSAASPNAPPLTSTAAATTAAITSTPYGLPNSSSQYAMPPPPDYGSGLYYYAPPTQQIQAAPQSWPSGYGY